MYPATMHLILMVTLALLIFPVVLITLGIMVTLALQSSQVILIDLVITVILPMTPRGL
jgi:hypothetical protein